MNIQMGETKAKERGVDQEKDAPHLHLGRYGTDDMIEIWGPEQTFQFSLDAQAAAIKTLSNLYSDIVPPDHAEELCKAANLNVIDPDRIRKLEQKTGHDVIAINKAWREKVSDAAASHINKARTSADTTETAKALQNKRSIPVVVDSLENIRDIVLEKAYKWIDVPHMDTSHWLDALPTYAGRPLTFYAEMLQSDIDFLKFVYEKSIKGKWGDATGNHHSASALEVDGMKLQEEYCNRLGVGHMIANAQIPGREFLSDIIYNMARLSQTMNNLAFYYAFGKGSDASFFYDANPEKRKGSAAMPHKDAAGGNPTTEEQAESYANLMLGNLVTSLASCKFRYARDLTGSSSDRDIFPSTFKFGDHVIRKMAETSFYLGLREKGEIAKERVERTRGIVTSQQVMTYLTDGRRANDPMVWGDAHDLMGRLATEAYHDGTEFLDVLLKEPEVMDRLGLDELKELTNPLIYVGQSREIIEAVINSCYQKKTFG